MLTQIYKKIFVIGGNTSGLAAASQARRENSGIEITVLESGKYISYGACGLPYFVSGIIKDISAIFTYPPAFFEEKRNIKILTGHKVISIDPFTKKITAEVLPLKDAANDTSGANNAGNSLYGQEKSISVFEYDRLIICSGAKPLLLDISGSKAPNVFYFRDIIDAVRIKKYIDEKKPDSACIIGGGSTGLLIAESMASLGIRTTIIECASKILNDYEDEITDYLFNNASLDGIQHSQPGSNLPGVKIITGSKVKSFNTGSSTGMVFSVTAAPCAGSNTDAIEIDSDIVIISAGIAANTDFISRARIDTGMKNAIKVSNMQQSSISNIYAAGDCSLVKNIVTGSYEYIPTAANAIKSGRVAGANAAGGYAVFEGSAETKTDRIFGVEIARTGINLNKSLEYRFNPIKIIETYPSHMKALPGSTGILCSLVVDKSTRRILGAQLAGKGHIAKRIDVFAAIIAAGFTVDQAYMLDTSYAPWTSTAPDAITRICGKAVSILRSLKQ